MLSYRNILISIFFAIYIILGIYLSITSGISHDQYHEQLNWSMNFDVIKSIFSDTEGYQNLLNYKDKYHGIAFHYISQPIQYLSYNFIGELNQVNLEGAYYLSRHSSIFLFFCISGIFFYFLCLKISNNENFSLLSTIIYLFYPYLFGHAQINGKDIPFLTLWIISTYFLFIIIENFYFEKKNFVKNILFLSFLTAFLISIRITGILILLEYLIALLILLNLKNINVIKFILENYLILLTFTFSLIFCIYLLNPIFWVNPMEFFNSIIWMSKYYNDICTLTLGKCMSSLNLPPSYFFIWFFFKLPIFILIGLFIYPLIEKKIFNNGIKTIYYGTFSFTILLIIFIFIIKNVALYDEIRHIMFLIPFIFLIALYNIFIFNKKIYYILSSFIILFFVAENISLNNYQYTWLNSLAKFTDIEKNFEIDYFGVSNKNLQKEIINFSKKNNINKNICIYGDLYTSAYLQTKNFSCFNQYSHVDSVKIRPFFAYQNIRNIKRSKPNDCDLIHLEKYNYTFYNKDIVVGKLWLCN